MVKQSASPRSQRQLAIKLASIIIIIAGMKAGAVILVPLLLAIFIAIICSPLFSWMRRKRVPNGLAILLMLLILGIAGILMIAIIGSSLNAFSNQLPTYQELFAERMSGTLSWLGTHGVNIPTTLLTDIINPNAILQLVAQLMVGFSGLLTNILMILIIVVLILLEANALPRKIQAAIQQPQRALVHIDEAIGAINKYLAIKTVFSLLTGILAALLLWWIGVDFPLLWGLLAFLLNFIPNVGSIIAAIPPLLLALIQFGIGHALLTAFGFIAINFTFGTVLEPRMMGRRFGLSTLVVFLSLIFWGWVLGPVGMLLSVPIMMVLKLALEHHEGTHALAIMLGSAPSNEFSHSAGSKTKKKMA